MIFLVFDDCPSDFADPEVLSAHDKKKGAERRIQFLRRKDEYRNQYLKVVSIKLEKEKKCLGKKKPKRR